MQSNTARNMPPTTKESSYAGFTLIETLVAISVLVVSIAGPLTIAAKGLSSAVFARDQITAFYLAQEGVEQIRNRRDENSIIGADWLAGLEACMNGTCKVDVKNNTIDACVGGSCPPLKYDDSTDFYNYVTGENSIFTRSVSMSTVNTNEAVINVTVSWHTAGFSRSFVVKEHILNWQR